ncbi:helix-turn-helix transcriptional regulator [Micromonospora sp. WMMD882]|uniref:helix-turn-helix domain-containing protein n=1 Tax=Micromonospora sp. WMMD882 TaxID=3015151 RepID=UPI00248ABB8A|nr:helix-turn-helix transcriptional regulator [Micromonospora sp. WMMD882]WBB79093.1 helix-turn-helix transcriptional regulator [Micromonospora sp. WMMD882]
MGSSAEATPQMAFARFVRRVIDDAREQRGWTVTELAAHTGVGRSTVFRWLAGDWHDYPELAKVRGFCAALDVPVAAAFRALGLPDGPPTARRAVDDAPVEADVQMILARLADPTVPADEKHQIRDLLRYLARRPARQAG